MLAFCSEGKRLLGGEWASTCGQSKPRSPWQGRGTCQCTLKTGRMSWGMEPGPTASVRRLLLLPLPTRPALVQEKQELPPHVAHSLVRSLPICCSPPRARVRCFRALSSSILADESKPPRSCSSPPASPVCFFILFSSSASQAWIRIRITWGLVNLATQGPHPQILRFSGAGLEPDYLHFREAPRLPGGGLSLPAT